MKAAEVDWSTLGGEKRDNLDTVGDLASVVKYRSGASGAGTGFTSIYWGTEYMSRMAVLVGLRELVRASA